MLLDVIRPVLSVPKTDNDPPKLVAKAPTVRVLLNDVALVTPSVLLITVAPA